MRRVARCCGTMVARAARHCNASERPGMRLGARVLRSSGFANAQPLLRGTFATRATAFAGAPGSAAHAQEQPRICIIGGGFGGLYTAIRLENLFWPRGLKPRITLIDQNARFVFKPLMYELLSGVASEDEIAPEYSTLLAQYAVQFVQDRVVAVSAAGGPGQEQHLGSVQLSTGGEIPFDWLVLALGAETNTDLAPGAAQHAIGFATLADIQRMEAALAALHAADTGGRALVTVVGAGYAGVELAAAVSERLGERAAVEVVTPDGSILPGQSAGLQASSQRYLQRCGVNARAGKVLEVSADSAPDASCADLQKLIRLQAPDGSTSISKSDLVLWTAGQKAVSAKSKEGLPFPMNERGLVTTEPTLQVIGNPHVFAIGDTAHVPPRDGVLPPTAQVALQQADYVAWNLWASINRRPLLPFKYQHLGNMMSLGRDAGAVALTLPLPAGVTSALSSGPIGSVASSLGVRFGQQDSSLTIDGPLGQLVRRAAYAVRQPTGEQQVKVGQSWVTTGLQDIQKMFARTGSRR